MAFDFDQWMFGGASQTPPGGNPLLGQTQGMLLNGAGNYGGLGAAAPQLDPSQQAAFRNAQLQQMMQLQRIASGQQQGAGELAAQRQGQNALAQQQAMARMARGGDAALAMRNAASNAAGIGLNTAGQSQQAAMQDQMNAQGLLSGVTNAGRGQDIGMAGQNAQLQQQQQQMAMQGLLGLGQLGQSQYGTQAGIYGAQMQNPGVLGGLLQAGGQAGAAAVMHSDERLKTDVAPADLEIDELFSYLEPKRYRYKNEARHGAGERVGVMAQDLERSSLGRKIVYDAPDGKALDPFKAISASLAGIARVHKRVARLERKAA